MKPFLSLFQPDFENFKPILKNQPNKPEQFSQPEDLTKTEGKDNLVI